MNGTEVMCGNGHANAGSSAFCSTCGERLMQLVAHGATTRVPSGQRTTTRQSPTSSTNRSTTTASSLGTSPVASTCART